MASGFQSVVIDDHAACAGALAGAFRSPVCRCSVQVYRGCDAPNQRTRRPRFRQHQLQRSCCVQQPKPRVLTSKIHHQPWRVRRRIPHRARIGRHRFADCSVRSRLNFNDSGDEQQQQSQPEPQAKGGASADGSSSGNATAFDAIAVATATATAFIASAASAASAAASTSSTLTTGRQAVCKAASPAKRETTPSTYAAGRRHQSSRRPGWSTLVHVRRRTG